MCWLWQAGNIQETMKACKEVFDLDAHNQDAFCDRAEAHILNEQYEEGNNWQDFSVIYVLYTTLAHLVTTDIRLSRVRFVVCGHSKYIK